MSLNDSAMETALLEIAKDLLQASDDLASTDPQASEKLAREAYEIGRDLGIVRHNVDGAAELAAALRSSTGGDDNSASSEADEGHADGLDGAAVPHLDERSEDDLLRILDRQKALLPNPVDLAPVRKSSRNNRSLTFESTPPRRSGWFGWMRSKEWRHAG